MDRIPEYRRRASVRRAFFSDFSGGVDRETDPNILPRKNATDSRNFRLSSGALREGEGAKAAELPTSDGFRAVGLPEGVAAKRIYHFRKATEGGGRDDRLLVYADDGRMYETAVKNGDGFRPIPGMRWSAPPVGINYRYGGEDVFLLSSPREKLAIYSGTGEPSVAEGSPFITSMAVHGERVFATSGTAPSTLFYSDDFDPSSWYVSLEEAGFVDFPDRRGELLAAIEFLGYVYVFRSYGITRLTAAGDQTDFSATHLYSATGRIFGGSVTLAGDRVIFLAEDGLYEFDGLTARRVAEGIAPLVAYSNDRASGRFLRGSFYLALDVRGENGKERAVLVYRPSDGTYYLMRGVGAESLETVEAEDWSELYFVLADGRLAMRSERAELFGEPLEKVWTGPLSDYGSPGREKALLSVSLFTDGDIELTAESERESRTVPISGGKGLKKVRIGIRGSAFRLGVRSTAFGARVSRIAAEIGSISD